MPKNRDVKGDDSMAQTVHLWLTIDGNYVEGESSVVSLDRAGTIECSSFRYGVTTPYGRRSGRRTGRRQHEPVKVHKRIDKSTPLLLKALCNHEPVNEAEFRFYRPSPTGSGAEEHFFTVLLENGYISGVRQLSEDAIMGGEAAPPMMEEVTFVFQDITWTYEPNGATHHDSWRGE
jgi:type VI secretion system secreted protein Hcp